MKKDEFKNMHDYQSEVDASEIWAAIEPQVDALNEKRRKRRGVIFWWWGTGMLVLTLSVVYWGLTGRFEVQNTNSTIQIKNTQSPVVATPQSQTVNLSNLTKTNDDANSNTETKITTSIAQNSSIASATKTRQTETTSTKTQQANNDKETSNTQKKTIIKTASIKNNEQNKAMKIPIFSVKEEAIAVFSTTRKSNAFESISRIPMLAFSYVKMENEKKHPVLAYKDAVLDKPEKSNDNPSQERNFTLRLGLQAGASFVNRNMKAKDTNVSTLLQLRESTETVLEAQHYGLELTAAHRSGLELTFGLNQTTITERFDYLKMETDTSMTYGLRYIYTDLEGQTNNIYDSIPLVETMIMTKKIYNSHQLLEIPLTVGYNKAWKNWKIGAQAGVLVNISLQTEGKIMNDVDDIIQIEEQDIPIYKARIGLGYHLGLSLEREVFPNISLSISPFVRAYPTNFTSETYRISQKYMLFGGNVGLRYQFGK